MLVALLAPLLAVVMVATTSTPAQAFQPKPKRPTISPFTRGVPGSVMRASPIGRVVNVIYAGMALYQVGHSLMDMTDNPAGEGSQKATAEQGTALCLHTVLAVTRTGATNGSISVTSGSSGLTGSQAGRCDSTSVFWSTNWTCQNGSSSTTFTNSGIQYADNPSGSATTTVNLCSGGTVTQVNLNPPPPGGENERYVGMTKDFPIPDEVYLGKTTVHCTRLDGTGFTISTSDVGGPREVQVPSCYVSDPTSWPDSMTIAGGPNGGTTRDQGTTTIQPDYLQKYPDCFDALNGMKCTIRVWISGDPCTVGDLMCADWQHLADTHPELVKCKWGGYVVPLADCAPLAKVYVSGSVEVVGTDTNGNPVPAPSTTPAPGTGTSTFPKSGTNWDPLSPAGPENQPAPSITPTTDPDSPSCWGQGWSWNPVSWVYVPVKCAMLWAFVPDAPPSFADIPSPLPGGWLPTLPDMGSGGCGAVTMPQLSLGFHDWHVGPTRLFSTCDDPWPLVRTFTYNGQLVLVLVAVVWMGFRAVTSGLGMGVNFNGQGGDDD